MGEAYRSGINYLREVTRLLQRVRSAHPTAGQFEAADLQWWWRTPRTTDEIPQLFWFDDAGVPEAAVIATDWGDGFALDPIVLPVSPEEWRAHVVARGLAHATEHGLATVDFVIDREDEGMARVLAAHGFTEREDEGVESWLRARARPPISPLPPSYRLESRAEASSAPHPMVRRNGPGVEERLRETTLYRPDLDLVVFDGRGAVAAYGLFWFDPATATGLVEPMRTEDEHQGRGVGRHVLTTGIDRLAAAGAERIKICFKPDNEAARHLYLSTGFVPVKECVVVSRS